MTGEGAATRLHPRPTPVRTQPRRPLHEHRRTQSAFDPRQAERRPRQPLDEHRRTQSAADTVGALAPALGVDQPRASRLAAQAVSSGLLERVADQRDGRRSVLRLTAAGNRAVAAARAGRRTAMAAAMADWTPAERAEFARLLERFVDRMDRPAD
ncbi:MarR family winged helix-turn-helix transcriptional regulator [Nocardia beijingensis]|uniref:MarR family winged helix-turn-helix transcriptional regulator n=1 Tax=Nocardia beijingensis TaxID=95162 RepID=A0ABW7WE14_9NOCA